jgi:thiol-disulfide isomerase/thioredoxin
MSKVIAISVFIFLLGCSSMPCCTLAQTEKNAGSESRAAGVVAFARPQSREALDYLGLEGDAKTFTLSQVKADVVIVEVFSWDCHFCQRQAPRMVQFYDLLVSKGYSHRVKIIGIGATNTDLEIREYQRMFKIPFPLIADPDYKSYGVVGDLKIPSISVLMRDARGVWRLVYSKSREQRAAGLMLKDLLSATGLESTKAS